MRGGWLVGHLWRIGMETACQPRLGRTAASVPGAETYGYEVPKVAGEAQRGAERIEWGAGVLA